MVKRRVKVHPATNAKVCQASIVLRSSGKWLEHPPDPDLASFPVSSAHLGCHFRLMTQVARAAHNMIMLMLMQSGKFHGLSRC